MLSRLRHHRTGIVHVWVVRIIEQGNRFTAYSRPVDRAHHIKICRSKIKGTSVQIYGHSSCIYFPESTTMALMITPGNQVFMQMDIAKAKLSIQCDDEFLHALLTQFHKGASTLILQ